MAFLPPADTRKPVPDIVRKAVMARAQGRCEQCNEIAKLQLHHLRYLIRRPLLGEVEWIFGKETTADLAAICDACHISRHRDADGNFTIPQD